MPTTAGGFPYPALTDTPDGPAQIKALAEALGAANIQVFTGSGTWNKPAIGIRAVLVRVIGGGGGGGGAAATSGVQAAVGGGGRGGAYGESLILVGSLGATETVTVGAGGAGVSGAAGGAGGTSSFGSHVSAAGGAGGGVSGATAGPSGVDGAAAAQTITGQVQVPGGANGLALLLSTSLAFSGQGGSSVLGAGGFNLIGVNGSGGPGQGYGGGGGGALNYVSQAARAGGAGTAGVVIVLAYL